jgi:hypothetical protein
MGHDSFVVRCLLSDVFRGHGTLATARTIHTAQHGATYRTTRIFSDTAVRTPNPAVTVLPADTGTEASSYIYLVSLWCF